VAEHAQHQVEVILMKQLASYLATPVFVVDSEGTLVFFNEPAEGILGCRYEEEGEMPLSKWSTIFLPTDEFDEPLPPDALPLVRALEDGEPGYGTMWITGRDGMRRHISVTAFPLVGQNDRGLGAVAIFWESHA
jgi:PAS domain-containing protein